MRRVILVRHGQTDWNVAGRLQGASDIPLNSVGIAQAEAAAAALAPRLGDVDTLYASDLVRARDTAAAIARHAGARVVTDARLRERCYGVWEGLAVAERAERFPEDHQRWLDGGEPQIEGYETHEQVRDRALAAIEERADEATTVCVTHGSTARVLTCALLGLTLGSRTVANLGNTQWAEFTRVGEGPWVLASLNARWDSVEA